MKTNVYIDGFNFYYACFKRWEDPACHEFKAHGPYKWVDFRGLSEKIFPNDSIHRIQYCTAIVKGTPSDPNKAMRQEIYLRALRASKLFHVRLGHFEERQKRGRVTEPLPCRRTPPCLSVTSLVNINVREEKGSDVNLATYLLKDAFLGDFEQALVISNDSDLASAIHVARVDAKRLIHVLSPSLSVARELRSVATSAGVLDKTLIPLCQLPATLTDRKGNTITKPRAW